jgi:Fe-S-cluster-containing hydrogenase component 2
VECIDRGACVPVCPVTAIFALYDLPEKWRHYTELNESYVKGGKFGIEQTHQAKTGGRLVKQCHSLDPSSSPKPDQKRK